MLTLPRVMLLCVVGAALLGLSASAPSGAPGLQRALSNTPIQYLVIIQEENWSFDSLFGTFPGADGFPTPGTGTPTPFPQTDKFGTPLAVLPGPNPRCGAFTPGPPGCFPTTVPPVPYDYAQFIDRARDESPDTIHEFFQEQFQLDGGRMDQFAAWNEDPSCSSDCPGGVMGYWNLNAIPTTTPSMAHYARQYTLTDHFHHAMFGASVPNWFWSICACALLWPSPPPQDQIQVTLTPRPPVISGSGSAALLPGPSGTQIFYVVNNPPQPTPFTAHGPPLQTLPTIGDRLDAKGVTWAWYWDAPDKGVANIPAPWIWFANYTFGTAGFNAHVIGGTPAAGDAGASAASAARTPTPAHDPPNAASTAALDTRTPILPPTAIMTGTRTPTPIRAQAARSVAQGGTLSGPDLFLTALALPTTLPQVAYVQPGGDKTLHPGLGPFAVGDSYVAGTLIPAIMASQPYRENKMAIIITFDENGGRWDHVPPPRGTPFVTDQFGPGSRIPGIIISPWARQCHVDHTYYDSSSITAFIEKNWNLTPLATRDAVANPLSGAFDFSTPPQPIQQCSAGAAAPTSRPSPTRTATPTPTVVSPTVQQAINQVASSIGTTGERAVLSASAVGETVAVSGGVSGTGTVTGSMSWRLTATVPTGVAPGTVPVAVLATRVGAAPSALEGFPCAPVAAGAATVACTGTTVGNALEGSTVVVVFGPGLIATGTVDGPGPAAAALATGPGLPPPPLPPAPPLPPLPPSLLPPLPPFALVPPGAAPLSPFAAAAPGAADVPVIPEAGTAALLASGLAVAGLLARLRRRPPRR